jgi:hypothetical protein
MCPVKIGRISQKAWYPLFMAGINSPGLGFKRKRFLPSSLIYRIDLSSRESSHGWLRISSVEPFNQSSRSFRRSFVLFNRIPMTPNSKLRTPNFFSIFTPERGIKIFCLPDLKNLLMFFAGLLPPLFKLVSYSTSDPACHHQQQYFFNK